MPKKPYVSTEYLGVRLPIGIYQEMIKIMDKEKKWNSPQQFIQDALNEKIERRKKLNYEPPSKKAPTFREEMNCEREKYNRDRKV